jgi:phosphate transport system protein
MAARKTPRTRKTARIERHFEADLRDIKHQILEMGGAVESMIEDATRHLVERDHQAAVRVLALERDVNMHENAIDEACLRVLALHQPLASDLRFLAAMMKMTADLERIGDLAVNLIQAAKRLAAEPQRESHKDLPRIARLTLAMVHSALNALIERDAEAAQRVLEADAEVDALKQRILEESIGTMKSDGEKVVGCLHIILSARHYERIADHATNIAEEVIYIATGRDVRHHQEEREAAESSGEETSADGTASA